MESGSTRLRLKQEYEFEVETLHDAHIRGGDLGRFDVIVLTAQPASGILRGNAPGSRPEEYVGRLGVEGAAALKRFVEGGGRLVAEDGATDFAIEQFGLPVRNATGDLPREQFFIPGSLIRLEVDRSHPLAHGMPGEAAAMFVDRRGSVSRAFEVVRPAAAGERRALAPPVEVVARWAKEDLLLSGFELGARRHLAGRPAMVRVPLGGGDVVLIGFRSHFRAYPSGTYKLLFNAIQGGPLQLSHPPAVTADD